MSFPLSILSMKRLVNHSKREANHINVSIDDKAGLPSIPANRLSPYYFLSSAPSNTNTNISHHRSSVATIPGTMNDNTAESKNTSNDGLVSSTRSHINNDGDASLQVSDQPRSRHSLLIEALELDDLDDDDMDMMRSSSIFDMGTGMTDSMTVARNRRSRRTKDAKADNGTKKLTKKLLSVDISKEMCDEITLKIMNDSTSRKMNDCCDDDVANKQRESRNVSSDEEINQQSKISRSGVRRGHQALAK